MLERCWENVAEIRIFYVSVVSPPGRNSRDSRSSEAGASLMSQQKIMFVWYTGMILDKVGKEFIFRV